MICSQPRVTVNNNCLFQKLTKNIVILLLCRNSFHSMVIHFHFSIMLSSFRVLFIIIFFNFNAVYFLHPKFHVDLVSFSLLSMPYSHCFCWLSLSLCDCFVAKLEPAVSVASYVQAPSTAAPQPQGSLQVPQPSSLPLGLLAGICTRVACRSVRLGIRQTSPPFFPHFPLLQYYQHLQ